jgi:hypothetical protein
VSRVCTARLCELIQECRAQDEAAWLEFQSRFARIADRVLGRFPNLSQLEREEAQDNARVSAALEINAGRVKATTDGAMVSFMKTVVVNAARDVWRRRRPNDPLPPVLRDDGPSPAERAKFKAQLDCAERVIGTWNPDDRFIFAMKLEQVPSAVIKADLQRLFCLFITVEAVDVRYFRLRAKVRHECGTADD